MSFFVTMYTWLISDVLITVTTRPLN